MISYNFYKKATFIIMYNYEELDELFANSNNKVQVTMELATNIL